MRNFSSGIGSFLLLVTKFMYYCFFTNFEGFSNRNTSLAILAFFCIFWFSNKNLFRDAKKKLAILVKTYRKKLKIMLSDSSKKSLNSKLKLNKSFRVYHSKVFTWQIIRCIQRIDASLIRDLVKNDYYVAIKTKILLMCFLKQILPKYFLPGRPKKMALFDPTEGLEELLSLNNLMLNSAKLVAVSQG